MKKQRKTKAAALLLAALLTVPFPAGCRREEEPKPKDEYGVITADDLPENTGATGVLTHVYKSAGRLIPEGSQIVTDGAQYDAETGTLFCVLRDGWRDYRYAEIREDAGVAREFLLPLEEDFHLRRYAVRDGKLAFDFSRTTENARGEYVTEEFLSLTDLETGETVTGEELNGFLAKDWAGSVNPIDLILDAEGDIVLLTDEQIAVFSPDLSLKRVVSFQRNSPELAADPEGAVWVEYLDSKGEYVLAPFDKETGECGEELAVTGAVKSGYGSREFCFADGGELVWRDDRGVWTLRDPHADPASPELLMDWKNSCLANADVMLLWASRPDLLLIWEGYASDGEDDDTLSLWRSSEDVDLSKLRVIELANTIQMPEYMASAVVEFNKTHPDVRIAVRDYYSEYYYSNDFVYVASKLIQDILTGTYRPDIVLSKSGREDLEYFRAHSMTLDLGPYLDRDPAVNRENVFGCLQKTFATEEGGMWAIPDEFSVRTLVAPDSYWKGAGGGSDGWTLSELLDAADSLPRDMILMQGLTKQNAASKLLGQNGYGAF
ncbi:MAG: hypothetical protein II680_09720, partial [Clostridia bacterium]|nr:hypothetical protein [Clostridia bacterium]